MLILFLKSMLAGFTLGAIVGPIGILCLRRTLAHGFAVGLATGIGAAVGESFYGVLAIFGFTHVTDLLLSYSAFLSGIGGAYLCYLGFKSFVSKPVELDNGGVVTLGLIHSASSTFFLTLVNPVAIVAFVAIFTSLGFAQEATTTFKAVFLSAGVFLGSCVWWVLLPALTALLRTKLTEEVLTKINRGAGVVIFLFGIASLINALR